MKKCNYCGGKGKVYIGIKHVSQGFSLKAVNLKTLCTKCHGSGVR